jgi:hypothetical protein
VIWLSGAVGNVLRAPRRPDLGVMGAPRSLHAPQLLEVIEAGVPFALDNGAFREFDEAGWLAWLERAPSATPGLCMFAVVPDVVTWDTGAPVGDPQGTYERFWTYAPGLRALGYRIAFASQDGATADLVPWSQIDCLFIGGSTRWKFSDPSLRLVQAARRRGLWVHCGRIQASRRLLIAQASGVDSCDGTSLAFDPARIGRVQRRLDQMSAQMCMELV